MPPRDEAADVLDRIRRVLGPAFDEEAEWSHRVDFRGLVIWTARPAAKFGRELHFAFCDGSLICAAVRAGSITFSRIERYSERDYPVSMPLRELPAAPPELN